MHNYTFSMTRESDDRFVSFPFDFTLTVRLPADEVWREVREGLVDHSTGWMWPTQYSQPSIATGRLALGSRLVLTYQIPNPNNPSGPKKNATYEFDIVGFDDEARRYEYRATADHPFLQGGGSVKVTPIGPHHSELKWVGMYRHISGHKGKEAQGDVFAYFLGMFFTALAQNVKNRVGYGEDVPMPTAQSPARS